jgi:hypothetical protein
MTSLGPSPIYQLAVGGPALGAPSIYVDGDAVRSHYDTLFPSVPGRTAHWSSWLQIVLWAEAQGLPIMYAPSVPTGGVKLACTDPDTVAAVVAYWQDELATDPTRSVSVERSDGDGNWAVDPGNGEHTTLSPAQRLYALADAVRAALAVDYPGIRVGILAYAACAADLPLVVHPDVAYGVAGPAYLPPGLTVEGVTASLVSRGATVVLPYVYWAAWYLGHSTCLLLDPARVIAALAVPRHGAPDGIGGGVPWWVALAPSIWALSHCLGLDSPTVLDFVSARGDYLRRAFSGAWSDVDDWYALVHEGRPTTPDLLHRLYQHCLDALDSSTDDEQQRVIDLVLHTRHLDLHLHGTDTERIAWLWSIATRHVVDVRVVARSLGVPHSAPGAGVVLEPGVDDPAWCRQLCCDRLGQLDLLPWEPEHYPPPALWPGDGDATARRGSLAVYDQPHKPRAGTWWVQSDADGFVPLTLQGGYGGDVPDLQVSLYDLDGGVQHTWTVPGTTGTVTPVSWVGAPLATYEIRSDDGAHTQGLDIDAAPGLRLAYRPDPATLSQTTVGRITGWMRLRPGVTQLGLETSANFLLWAPGVVPNPGWSTGAHYEATAEGYQTITIPDHWDPDGLGVWVAVSGARIVPLHGAAPYLCRRPDEGPEVSP